MNKCFSCRHRAFFTGFLIQTNENDPYDVFTVILKKNQHAQLIIGLVAILNYRTKASRIYLQPAEKLKQYFVLRSKQYYRKTVFMPKQST